MKSAILSNRNLKSHVILGIWKLGFHKIPCVVNFSEKPPGTFNTVHNRAVLHPQWSASIACARGCGCAHAHRHIVLNSESWLSQSDHLSSSAWRVVHFHNGILRRRKYFVVGRARLVGVAVHLVMELAGVVEYSTKARYPAGPYLPHLLQMEVTIWKIQCQLIPL